jgi:type II secretory pathway pseudopilin PulG
VEYRTPGLVIVVLIIALVIVSVVNTYINWENRVYQEATTESLGLLNEGMESLNEEFGLVPGFRLITKDKLENIMNQLDEIEAKLKSEQAD